METTTKKKHILRNTIFIIIGALIACFILYKLISGYIDTLPKFTYTYGDYSAENLAGYPDTSFAVMSDIHYYDTSLGTSGSAFEECMNSDRKLVSGSAGMRLNQ